MDYQSFIEMLAVGPSEPRSMVIVEKARPVRYRIASGVVMACWAQSVPVRHTVFSPPTNAGYDETKAFLTLAQSDINLPFLWAQQIDDRVIRDSFLDCIAGLAVLVVARARNIQGLAEFAQSTVRREWKTNAQGGSLSKVMDEIGLFVSPTPPSSFVAGLKRPDDPVIKKSINYLVAGLILLKDCLVLSVEKSESSHSVSVAVIDNASTFMGGYTNSDDFYTSFIKLSLVMSHSLVLVDEELLPEHVLSMINNPKVINGLLANAA
jgi:hypothetical protein